MKGVIVVAVSALLTAGCVTQPDIVSDSLSGGGTGIQFKSLSKRPATRTGTLLLPTSGQAPFPAVVMIHGTRGPDARYGFHTPKLLEAGIAVFQVDFKSGVFTDARDRPNIRYFTPMLYGALGALRARPEIDPERIATMGFSLGGAVSIQAAMGYERSDWLEDGNKGFSAHVGYYPGCRWRTRMFDRNAEKNAPAGRVFAGGPILILAGSEDSYGDGEHCPGFADMLNAIQPGMVELHIYPGANHGFDGDSTWSGFDRGAVGSKAIIRPDPAAAHAARETSTAFLMRLLANE